MYFGTGNQGHVARFNSTSHLSGINQALPQGQHLSQVPMKVKRFKCEVCDKAFKLKTDLARHSVVHTGEKPYACDICGQKYSRQSTVDLHKRRTHQQLVCV